jgi:hypothetical protein
MKKMKELNNVGKELVFHIRVHNNNNNNNHHH